MTSLALIQSVALSVCVVHFLQGNAQVASTTEIQLRGNKVFSRDQLLKAMQLAARTNRDGSTEVSIDRDEVEKGTDRTREFMVDHGYLLAEVGDPWFERSDRRLTILISITEGRLFRLGRIRFENATLFSQERLLEIFGMKEGEIAAYLGTRSREGFERLKRIYSNYGYLNWTIIPKIDINVDEGVVDCTLRLKEGHVFSIRRITFTGETEANQEALRGQFLIGADQVFSWQLLKESLLRVHRLGLTEEIQPGDLELQLDESTHQVDITINLKESPQLPKQ